MRARSVNLRRRDFLCRSGAASAALLLSMETAQAAEPTPACADDHHATPRQTAGPFFLPNSPERTMLVEQGIAGTRIVLTGRVISVRCQPIPGALLDFWHADDAGQYDIDGFRLRGHQFADSDGRYCLETIVPGLYPGRTRHFHVSVQAPNRPVLVTQLYFPREPQNTRDGLFDRRLLMSTDESGKPEMAHFDFVIVT
ncbi:protocatechuate 3,4-dioxygenase subunit beta [Caballeronia arationis]|jgi:protocatechuate 3,4-dioxygenase beta subunit|uniref:Protocatechuate 3,4-dioxygenase beta subunit n=1 Tax=Caballeronia arationis TaxID=1777142 RepID=A0A7Z7N4B4_9BURK|nr:intradiol ring-cleavage dioxygenase [Caballeronia arationis]SAK76901.1 protocatechuate 3,4-dioxygenase subunit beta [Caballeronia arationis]SOE81655.1 Protocatechuate 3,4-dioxygenase beta subunit [Caballeronia arationis]